MDLAGQVALVTGGSRGLGRAFAQALAEAGVKVAITGRSADELTQAASEIGRDTGQVLAVAADVTDPDAASRVVSTVEETLGAITLLINNAGQGRAVGKVGTVDPALWWREVEVNLRGPFLYAQATVPLMRTRKAGRIVNVVSGAGLGPTPYLSAYNVSKTALIRLSETLALENAADGISVFALNPGTVRTALTDYVHDSPEVARQAPDVQQWFKRVYSEGLDRPASDAAGLMLRIAAGHGDALSGWYIGVADDLDALMRQQRDDPRDGRHRLRLQS